MSNNNQNQMGPPSNYPYQAVALYQQGNNYSDLVPQVQPSGSHQPSGNWMDYLNVGNEEMETSNQMAPPNAMESPRDRRPDRLTNARQPHTPRMGPPISKNLDDFQKSRLYQAFETLNGYPNDDQMRHAANDMNVEFRAVVEYFRGLQRRSGMTFGQLAGINHHQSNNNQFRAQFFPNTGIQETSNAAPNQFFPNPAMQAAPQPRALKRASNTAPELASKCRRQDPEPME